MSKSFYRRNTCRLCLSNALELVLKLEPTPIGDAYIPADRLNEEQKSFPMELFLCLNCGHLQLLDVIDPSAVYRDYIYKSSDSLGLLAHFQRYTDEIIHHINPPPRSLVIDIGSNDGSLLRFFKNYGMQVLGIDPAKDIAAEASKSGIITLPEFFDIDLARKIKKEYGPAYIITSNNTFANVDDLVNMIRAIRELLAEDGVFVFETGYVFDLIQKLIFDNIYHEHLSYFSVKPLETFFRNNKMELIDVKRVATKGGSIRGIAQNLCGKRKTSQAIKELIMAETQFKLHKVETIKAFALELKKIKSQINNLLAELKAKGKSIIGYGASVGATTMSHYFNLNKDLLMFIVDDNSRRQNLYSPGLHIPVKSPDMIYKHKPDYIFILAWLYAEVIIMKNQAYLKGGGHFIVPLPSPKITGGDI